MPPVIIVGAGMAGIAAACSLHERGVNTIVVEAADRIGGRLRTVKLGSSSVDLGASWIHGPIGNPLTPLAADAGVVGYPTTFTDSPNGLLAKQPDGTVLDSAQFASGVREFWGQVEAEAQRAKALGQDQPDRTFGQVMSTGTVSFPNVDANTKAEATSDSDYPSREASRSGFEFAAWVALQGREACDIADLSFDGYGYGTREGGDILLADGGYGRLINHLAGDVEDIRLKTHTSAIRTTPYGFEVVVEKPDGSNEVLTASAVIVTVSIGVLQAGVISFSPPLPEDSLRAIDSIGMGTNEKLAIALDDWPWDRGLDYAVRADANPDDPYIAWLLRSDAPIAVSFAGGSRARAQARQTDAESIEAGIAALTELFGPLPAITGFCRSSWTNDPLTLGSYSFSTSLASATAREQLSSPAAPGLVLTGEAMNATDYGTAHGALIAGRRAGNQIADYLSDPNQAPGTPDVSSN